MFLLQVIPDLLLEQEESDSGSENIEKDEETDKHESYGNNDVIEVGPVGKESASGKIDEDEQKDKRESTSCSNDVTEVGPVGKESVSSEKIEEDEQEDKQQSTYKRRKDIFESLKDSLSIKEKVYGKRQRKPRNINE